MRQQLLVMSVLLILWIPLTGVFVWALCAAAARPVPSAPSARDPVEPRAACDFSHQATHIGGTAQCSSPLPRLKRSTVTLLWSVICLGALQAGILSAAAGSVRSRQAEGIVERMDGENRQVVVALQKPARVWVFDLPRYTPIYNGQRRVSVAEVRTGDVVRVDYRSPLFGKRYCTRVSIVSNP